MSSLREVKDRIASVRSTLKITSAMKLVASSKLRKAQKTIEALRPYEDALNDILAAAASSFAAAQAVPEARSADSGGVGGNAPRPLGVQGDDRVAAAAAVKAAAAAASNDTVAAGFLKNGQNEAESADNRSNFLKNGRNEAISDDNVGKKIVVLAFASNSSMCGAFNVNVIKKALATVQECGGQVELWAFGRKMAEGMRKAGITPARDYSNLVAHPSFDAVAELASELRDRQAAGEISGVQLVYSHFVSTGRQVAVSEWYLAPAAAGTAEDEDTAGPQFEEGQGFILEPSGPELMQTLMPQLLNFKLYAALLDSAASEHAARMVAMQAATDNGESLLSELTLEYNKGRQQKITSEILDLVSGNQD